MLRPLLLASGLFVLPSLLQGAEFSPEALTFFEQQVRPLLAEHCYSCHSVRAKKLQAGLRLDSRSALLRGGDSGEAIVPGKPDESLLIEAVRYEGFEMPPKNKLPAKSVQALVDWVNMGAPWPDEPEPQAGTEPEAFDWRQRITEHWCWQPVQAQTPPQVRDQDWPRGELDHFILARLEEAGLAPAADADRRTWLRRVTLDLVGLLPSREEVQAFLADQREGAEQRVVDRLLRSPHFGEKWARHWLDLVRYGETLGHEFDYPLRHAYRYRDYVIRALNEDVPYDQFVHEHVAGDLLDPPRRHRTEGFNESIIGTGFWFLGEACHAPTDVKADESDRIDNQLDVFSKTFLGVTLACARCHDHKFDPIPTTDYYALAGYLQSSRRQEALLDPHGKIAKAKSKLTALAKQRTRQVAEALPTTAVDAEALRAALVTLLNAEDKQQVEALAKDTHPFYALAKLKKQSEFAAERARLQQQLAERQDAAIASVEQTERFVDFREDSLEGWYITGEAFSSAPTKRGELNHLSPDEPFSRPGVAGSRRLGGKFQGVLRSPTFVLNHKRVHYKVNGSGLRIRLIVDGYTMDEFNALLFKGMQHRVETKGRTQWTTQQQDVYHYVGHRAHIEVIDHGDGFAALEQIRFSDDGAPVDPPHPFNLALLGTATRADTLLATAVSLLQETWKRVQRGTGDASDVELANWMVRSGAVSLGADAKETGRQMRAVHDQLPKPMPVIALADGDAEDEYVFIRGNHKNLGPQTPRRLLLALAGEDQPAPERGSGRLELARRMTAVENPTTARVIVNRLWHHLLGRGIVPSVDDLGRMGQPPSHPALLDWLAHDFVHRKHWSLKAAIRQIVLSRTYRQSGRSALPAELVQQVDPDNALLHRAPIRRMTGEAICDALLQLSGGLDLRMYGPSVPVHLTSFMEGRGRPRKNGPRDGEGRRSLYIEVRRNFLSPMMLAFDRPSPFSTMGRRSTSNVPAQSLMLMNDPFVMEQAEGWAARLRALAETDAQRIQLAFEQAFSRPPTPQQLANCQAFLAAEEQSGRAWKDLCHMLLNMKAFIFVN